MTDDQSQHFHVGLSTTDNSMGVNVCIEGAEDTTVRPFKLSDPRSPWMSEHITRVLLQAASEVTGLPLAQMTLERDLMVQMPLGRDAKVAILQHAAKRLYCSQSLPDQPDFDGIDTLQKMRDLLVLSIRRL